MSRRVNRSSAAPVLDSETPSECRASLYFYGYVRYWDAFDGSGGMIFCDYYDLAKREFSSCRDGTYNLVW